MLIFHFFAEGPLPSVLQQVAVPVINNTVCEAMYRNAGYIEHIPHIFICAGWRNGGFDSCEVSMLYLHSARIKEASAFENKMLKFFLFFKKEVDNLRNILGYIWIWPKS